MTTIVKPDLYAMLTYAAYAKSATTLKNCSGENSLGNTTSAPAEAHYQPKFLNEKGTALLTLMLSV